MVLARNIMDSVQALYNDLTGSVLTYPVQMPYLNMALGDLRSQLEVYGISATNKTIQDLVVPAECTEIKFAAILPNPSLPGDLIEPLEMYERTSGSEDSYIPMQKMQFLPPYTTLTNALVYWVWQGQKITLIGANSDVEVRIDYTASVLPRVTDPDDVIGIINAESFLQYRTAALCSKFIGENEGRSSELNQTAQIHLDTLLTSGIKHQQAIATRRRPFNQSFKTWGSYLQYWNAYSISRPAWEGIG